MFKAVCKTLKCGIEALLLMNNFLLQILYIPELCSIHKNTRHFFIVSFVLFYILAVHITYLHGGVSKASAGVHSHLSNRQLEFFI